MLGVGRVSQGDATKNPPLRWIRCVLNYMLQAGLAMMSLPFSTLGSSLVE